MKRKATTRKDAPVTSRELAKEADLARMSWLGEFEKAADGTITIVLGFTRERSTWRPVPGTDWYERQPDPKIGPASSGGA